MKSRKKTNKPNFENAELSAKYQSNLNGNAKPSLFQFAKENRRIPTKAERILWSYLKNRQLKGKKFRRQHPILDFELDFYCHECKLAVELDGEIHKDEATRDYDSYRTRSVNEMGIVVIRFWNSEVENNISKVLEKISEYLK